MISLGLGGAGRVYISYRRQETATLARQLYDLLVAELGVDRVFKDEPSERLQEAVRSCRVLLALIGPQWLTVVDENGKRRLDDPEDVVRVELETAYYRSSVRVIPVLIDNAKVPEPWEVPSELIFLTWLEPVAMSSVTLDASRLLKMLNEALNGVAGMPAPSSVPSPSRRRDDGGGMDLICENCGSRNRAGTEFCSTCGKYLAWDRSSPAVPRPPAVSAESPAAAGSAVLPPPPAAAGSAALPPPAHPQYGGPTAPRPPSAGRRMHGRTVKRRSVSLGNRRLRTQTDRLDQMLTGVDEAVSKVVAVGRLAFNPPDRMRQGRTERVEVVITRSEEFQDQLRDLRGKGAVQTEPIETSPYMAVHLRGAGFVITALTEPEQLLRPTAVWEFDVVPKRSGTQKLQLSVAMRVPLPNRADERISVPVVEREVRVTVDPVYEIRQFLQKNWQWLVATVAGLGAAVAAWIRLFGGE